MFKNSTIRLLTVVMRRFEIERCISQERYSYSGQLLIAWRERELQRVFNDGVCVKNYTVNLIWTGINGWVKGWKESKKRIFNLFQIMGNCKEIPSFDYSKNIKEVIKNTPFQYACKGKKPEYYAFWVKPMELFEKVGMYKIADYLHRGSRQGINMKATDLFKAMRITKGYGNIAVTSKFSGENLIMLQKLIKAGVKNITESDIESIQTALWLKSEKQWREIGFSIKDLQKLSQYTKLFSLYFDYIGFCIELGYDINNLHTRFPQNLKEAHDREMMNVKIAKDVALEKSISDRYLEDLKLYYFSNGDYFIRPPKSWQELCKEGSSLNHCVGTYAKKVGEKETTILFIRKEESPETSFYTLEWKNEKILQCRGKSNCDKTAEIEKFIEDWLNRSKKKKGKIMQQALAIAI